MKMIQIEIAWINAQETAQVCSLSMPLDSTVVECLKAWNSEMDWQAALDQGHIAIWGQRCATNQTCESGMRIECLKPLYCDPKVARRRRQKP